MNSFEILYDLDDKRIIPFLLTQELSSVYHHPAWLKGISKSFKHLAFYLINVDENHNIIGLIPFVLVASRLTGKRVVCLPFSTYCDPLLPLNEIEPGLSFLRSKFGNELKIDFRTLPDLNNSISGFLFSSEFLVHRLRMEDSLEKTYNTFHGRSVRASIRRAEKNGLFFEVLNTESGLKIFYKLEINLRKRLCLPPLPYNFFKNIFNELNKYNMVYIPIVKKDSKPVAAGFIVEFKDTTYLEYAVTDKNYFDLYANQKLFWEVIKLSHSKGIRFIDFGRTNLSNESLIIYKEKWNAQRFPVWHSIYPDPGFIKEKNKNLRSFLTIINKYLPETLLKIEGRILYPHLD